MNDRKTTVSVKSDLELLISRTFDAPRALVWEAMSNPEYVRRWYGLEILELVVCEIDHRVGGRWRYVLRAPDRSEHGFNGVYREIRKPERVVYTENYEPLGPGHEILNTATLDEIDERTTLTTHLLYKSKADRDGHIQSGMEAGASQSHDRLATLLASMS